MAQQSCDQTRALCPDGGYQAVSEKGFLTQPLGRREDRGVR